ncbi:MAG TPA: hypothetical protein PLG50_03235 [bacterium]|nr:hypothetical protein [bacterium]HQG44659.1 hypothetical protein [bacterium]HQI48279.1 hypothetical protein [bacterium]HQJ64895.1 hypothetical protein [bacterium]
MRPNSTRYRPPARKSQYQRNRERVFVILGIIALLVFLKVWQKVDVDHQLRRNGALQQQLLTLQGENALLEVRIDELRSMQRMDDLARSDLKLVPVPTLKLKEKNILDKLIDILDDWQREPDHAGRAGKKSADKP